MKNEELDYIADRLTGTEMKVDVLLMALYDYDRAEWLREGPMKPAHSYITFGEWFRNMQQSIRDHATPESELE